MARVSVLQVVIVYGLLISTVLGKSSDDDSCSYMPYLAGGLAGVAAVATAPLLLPALGFGAGGVVAGSIAAGLQTSTTAAGSLFALAQSAGVVGLGVGTKAAIGGAASVAGHTAYKYVKGCDGPTCAEP